MRLIPSLSLSLLCCAALSIPAAATPVQPKSKSKTAATTHHTATPHTTATRVSAHGKRSTTHAKKTSAPAAHAPMDTARATEIQTALIKQGYLSGEATGKWDADSMAAMQKLQSDNGWQTKIVPDSRALIKLGLGPTSPNN